MAKTYPNKWFNESMQGAAQTGDSDAGAMIAILKACLVDGFGALVPDSIVFDETTGWAKASFSSGHSYLKDSVISCSGSTPTDYNGEYRVMQVTTNDMWFELDTEPVAAAAGTLEIKIAPLGWEITHQNDDQNIIIFKPYGNLGNVSLRVDNSPYDGWSGTYARLMKVEMVENVIDIDSYDLIFTGAWAATGRYSSHSWELVGDNRIFFFLPEYGVAKKRGGFQAGYINSIRAGDNYHFIVNTIGSTDANNSSIGRWDQTSYNYAYYTYLAANMLVSDNYLARSYHQLEGVDKWKKTGLGSYNSDILPSVNPADNGFYMSTSKAMVLETNNVYRGTVPIMVFPLSNVTAFDGKNLDDLPEFPNKMFRMLLTTYDRRPDLNSVLVGFDISTVEV